MIKRLPAEWEPQKAVLLTWPHAGGDWGTDYSRVEQSFISMAVSISADEEVIIGAFDAAHQKDILTKLQANKANMAAIKTYIAPSNDVWARDHGPITIYQGTRAIQCDFKFNAWGAKYNSDLDDQITAHLFQSDLLKGYGYEKIPFILEGGSIETDGQGTLLTTTLCLKSEQRNSRFSQADLETKLKEYLGVERILWLENGAIIGDDTDGHIDTLARFFNPNTIGYVHCENERDPHFPSLNAMYRELLAFRDSANQPYNLVPLPLPDPIYDSEGNRLPATYANFLITNSQVLVPLYQDKRDQQVLDIFNHYFTNRKVVGIDCRAVIEQYGSLHCLTMQIPQIPSLSKGDL